MAKFTIRKHFEAPCELVFEVLSDFENAAENISAIEKLEVLTPDPIGTGTRFRETRVMFGKSSTEEMEITAYDPPHGYVVEADSCGAHYRAEYKIVGDISGTHVCVEFDTRAVSMMAKLMTPFSWLMTGPMKKMIEADLDDLGKVCESRAKELAGLS